MKQSPAVQKSHKNDSSINNSKKAFFFLRHNNDIDHMVPVMYKWLSTENIPTDIILTTKREYLRDNRINLLRKFKHANIFYITDLFKKSSLPYYFNVLYYKFDSRWDNIFQKNTLVREKTDKIIRAIADKIYKDTKRGFVAFDWITNYFVQKMVKYAKERNFITVSLPHGDRPYVSFFETLNTLSYRGLDSFRSSKIFDYVVVPNRLCFKRYDKHLEKDRIKILGSPRYCDEWLNIISKFTPIFDVEGSEKNLKLVLFLRNTNYPIFWDEVVRTIKLILQFPEVYLIVKHHPRNSEAKQLTRKLMRLYPDIKQNMDVNLKFIYGNINSEALLKWSDIILDVGTSITWEPVKKGKPVLMLEYTFANYSTVAYYIKASDIKYRDQLYDNIQEFIKNKKRKFYNETERRKFIKEIIDVPDKYVLERYCKFLKSCIDNSSKGIK